MIRIIRKDAKETAVGSHPMKRTKDLVSAP